MTHRGAHDAQAALDDIDVPGGLGVFYRTPPLRCRGSHRRDFWSEVWKLLTSDRDPAGTNDKNESGV